jgi:hypothetical protein
MGESYLEGGLIRNSPHQIFERFGFPTIEPLVVNFHKPLEVADAKDELLFQIFHLDKHFLVIQSCITHKSYHSQINTNQGATNRGTPDANQHPMI